MKKSPSKSPPPPSPSSKAFRENLARIMGERKLSFRELSQRSGVTPAVLCRITSGNQATATLETVDAVASAFDLAPATLLRK